MLKRARRYLEPFDVATEVGRGRERYRRIGLTTAASLAQRVIGIAVTLIAVRITLDYLGTERYGLYIMITSLVALVAFVDFGVGNGLINAIAEAYGRGDERLARVYVSTAVTIFAGLALVLGIAFAAAYQWVPWAEVFNVSNPQAKADAGPAVAVLAICVLVALPLGVVQRIQLGYQEGFANSVWLAFANLLSLAALIVAVASNAALPWLVLALVGPPVLALGLNGADLFGRRRPQLRPSPSLVSGWASRRILRLGSYFFVLQVAIAVGYESDNIVIAQVLGAEHVPEYAIPFRLFMFFPIMLGFLLYPLWPAYGEAIERRDIAWVKRTFRRSLIVSLSLTALVSILLVVFGRLLIRLWVGDALNPPTALLLGLGAWTLLTGLGGPLAAFLNGAGLIRFQAACAALMVLMNLPLSIFLAQEIGVSGVVWGSVISLLICVYVPAALVVPRYLRELTAEVPVRESLVEHHVV